MNILFEGCLTKMSTQLDLPVRYQLGEIALNALIGKKLLLEFLDEIYCIQCHQKTSKSFQGGYCFPCFRHLNTCGLCMIHPERCRYPEGICDPTDWVHAGCGLPHIIYLANTVHVKVGITRKTQVPTRWIDQGAIQAMPIFETTNRYLAGQMEVALKRYFPDKTPWQAMLKNQVQPQDLAQIRKDFFDTNQQEIDAIINQLGASEITQLIEAQVTFITYPVIEYPKVIKAFNLDRTPKIEGCLMGIKGQYLLLDTGVFNVRKFGGYRVQLKSETGC